MFYLQFWRTVRFHTTCVALVIVRGVYQITSGEYFHVRAFDFLSLYFGLAIIDPNSYVVRLSGELGTARIVSVTPVCAGLVFFVMLFVHFVIRLMLFARSHFSVHIYPCASCCRQAYSQVSRPKPGFSCIIHRFVAPAGLPKP